MSNIIDSIQLSGTVYTISGGSGGNYSAGRGIDITNDTISLDMPISAGTGSNAIVSNHIKNIASGECSYAGGWGNEYYINKATDRSSWAFGVSTQATNQSAHAEGERTIASGYSSHAEGYQTIAGNQSSHSEGSYTNAKGFATHAEGYNTIANNWAEHASGQYNVSTSASTTFGNSGNTLFSVGNGTADNARHNAFEIRQNGDIYLTLDGQDVKLQDHLGGGGGGNATVELTQAEYDALVSAGTVSANTYYIITDAQSPDITQYWTSAQTQSAITSAVSGKASQSDLETVSGQVANKQDTLVSGTNIKTINNESLLGSGNIDIQGGGGSSYSAGTNIDITNNTISCTLPIREGSNSSGKGIIVGDSECTATGLYGISLGHSSDASGTYSFCNGSNSSASGKMSFAHGDGCDANHNYTFMFGRNNDSTNAYQFSYGNNVKPKNEYEIGFGKYNVSTSASTTFGSSGNTLFSIGNGYDFSSVHNSHNAIEIRQNGDIYIADTNDTSVTGDYAYSLYPMIKLQGTITATAANTTALGGLSLVKLTQAEYDALVTKDNSTLYVIVN